MTNRPNIKARDRDAIVADVKALILRHGLQPTGLEKFARIARREIMEETRAQRLSPSDLGWHTC